MYFSACFSFGFQVLFAVPYKMSASVKELNKTPKTIDAHVKLGFDSRELRSQRWGVLYG